MKKPHVVAGGLIVVALGAVIWYSQTCYRDRQFVLAAHKARMQAATLEAAISLGINDLKKRNLVRTNLREEYVLANAEAHAVFDVLMEDQRIEPETFRRLFGSRKLDLIRDPWGEDFCIELRPDPFRPVRVASVGSGFEISDVRRSQNDFGKARP